jgi:hypothetical protein
VHYPPGQPITFPTRPIPEEPPMQKQPFRDRTVATAGLSSVVSPSGQKDSAQKPASIRRRWSHIGAENLYEKEREEYLKVGRRAHRREIPDDATFDGTGFFSDS